LTRNSPEITCYNAGKALKLALLELDELALFYSLNDKREIEKKAALYVAKNVLDDEAVEIFYHSNGRPYLKNGIKISVSHAYNKLAVLFSFNKKEIGIDIEKVRDKILKIKAKFLSAAELKELEQASLEKYTLYWGAKEAVYKAHCTEGLLFAEEIAVEPFTLFEKGGKIHVQVARAGSEKKYILHYQILNEYVLVYTDNEGE
jgi:4'-phosphopantetheinyl transferase